MISYETFIYSRVVGALRETYPGITAYSAAPENTPAAFPAVSIVETDNAVYRKTLARVIENASRVTYEVNVYSNTVGTKKSEAKDILEAVDAQFAALGFVRTMCNPVPNLQDPTIYRLIARYEGVIMPEKSETEEIIRVYTN